MTKDVSLKCSGKRGCGRWFPREHFEHGGRGRRLDSEGNRTGLRLLCDECYEKQVAPTNAIKARLRRQERDCAYSRSMRKECRKIWQIAGRLTSLTRKIHHVDHEVPLSGESAERPICGLTVPANLRIMPARLNLSKSNVFDDSDAARIEAEMMEELRERGLAKADPIS